MAFSTIIKKKCKCKEGCPKWPSFGFDGYFYSHAPQEIKDRQGEKAKKSYQSRLNRAKKGVLSRKLHDAQSKASATETPKNDQLEALALTVWFDNRMNTLEPICENCGKMAEWLKEPGRRKQWKSCQGHLLPKRHFKSIQTHPLNGMVLGSGYSGLCNCHDNYDASWEKAAKMKIWDEVVRRFLIMYPLITEQEQRFIPNQLLQEVNQI